MVGAGVSVRQNERVISVWCRGSDSIDNLTYQRIGERLTEHVFSGSTTNSSAGGGGRWGGGSGRQASPGGGVLQWKAMPKAKPQPSPPKAQPSPREKPSPESAEGKNGGASAASSRSSREGEVIS